MASLRGEERDALRTVSRASYANPFSEARSALDHELTGQREGPGQVEQLMAVVEARLYDLSARDALDPARLPADDWALVESAVLFECFHRHAQQLDTLVAAQLEGGARPVPVPFADEALGRMTSRGVSPGRAVRMLAVFWQLRRAYHFIVGRLVGVSPCMRRLREALWNAVFTHDMARFEEQLWDRLEDFSVLLLGETGTGKGQAAAAIGRSGFIPFDEAAGAFAVSFAELFVPLNLGQFPTGLLESELFGHRRGAFTGAVDAHEGVFARCGRHGAIFLDEIGEVEPPVQIKLLRVLQERVYTPVGSHEERRFEGRVLAATHRDLTRLRRDGRFRDDLFYRLVSDEILVPPLRQRLAEDPAELTVLVESLVARVLGAPDGGVAAAVRDAIAAGVAADHRWPGNVRELEQCVRRVLLTGRPGPGAPSAEDPTEAFLDGVRRGAYEARELTQRYCALLHERHGTYEEVARRTGLDRRTVRKYVQEAAEDGGTGAGPRGRREGGRRGEGPRDLPRIAEPGD
ncbi:MAG: sigma 54-interacting transcriptional regulator [Sandaracinaceae bacterium]